MGKACTLCGEEKPLDSFYAAKGCADGLAGQCIPCVKARARIRQIEKREEIRAYERTRAVLPHRVMQRAAWIVREKESAPERIAARNAVSNAVRDGKLRQQDCAFCGASKTVAHHHDYDRPLDVTWLCQPCHLRFHALENMSATASNPARTAKAQPVKPPRGAGAAGRIASPTLAARPTYSRMMRCSSQQT